MSLLCNYLLPFCTIFGLKEIYFKDSLVFFQFFYQKNTITCKKVAKRFVLEIYFNYLCNQEKEKSKFRISNHKSNFSGVTKNTEKYKMPNKRFVTLKIFKKDSS